MTRPPTSRSSLLALLGWPVEHSLSPAMHNEAFRALGMDAVYVACAVPPEALPDAVRGLHALGFLGANVTVPHKEAALSLCEEADGKAAAIGAANVLSRGDRGFRAHNTDADGFLRAVAETGGEARGARALVVGAGGAARAVVYALAVAGAASVTVANRTPERALALVERFRGLGTASLRATGLAKEELAEAAASATLIVNCTSLGLGPHPGPCQGPYEGRGEPTRGDRPPDRPPQAPADGVEDLWSAVFSGAPSGALAVDLVYHPPETGFLRAARQAGLVTLGGLPMLVHQAALSWLHWFGEPGPAELMQAAAMAEMELRRRFLAPGEGSP